MKLNKSFEQATYVVTMLALQKDHVPVKSQILSQILQVSDSYLKKILMKLARSGLIVASASKTGGYQLARSVASISLKDIFFALDLQADVVEFKHMAHQIYDDKDHVRQVEGLVKATLESGLAAFYDRLAELTIAELLDPEAVLYGEIDWYERAKKE